MKVLQMEPGFFELPDDFQGTVSDALRLMAAYLENPDLEPGAKTGGIPRDTPFNEYKNQVWFRFLVTHARDKKFCGSLEVHALDGVSGLAWHKEAVVT